MLKSLLTIWHNMRMISPWTNKIKLNSYANIYLYLIACFTSHSKLFNYKDQHSWVVSHNRPTDRDQCKPVAFDVAPLIAAWIRTFYASLSSAIVRYIPMQMYHMDPIWNLDTITRATFLYSSIKNTSIGIIFSYMIVALQRLVYWLTFTE